MPDWRDLVPLLIASIRPGPQGAAFLRAHQQSLQMLEERRRRQMLDDRAIEQQDFMRQNTIRDNERAEQAQRMTAAQQAAQRLSQVQGSIAERGEQIAETTSDPLQAQNQLAAEAFLRTRQYGVPASAASGTLPNMSAMISTRKKKRAEQLYDQAVKIYGPDKLESITLQTEEFGPVKPSALRQMFAAQAVDAQGAPVAPATGKPPTPPTPGSFEEFVDAPPERQAQIEAARKRYLQADDRPLAGSSDRWNPKQVATFNQIAGAYDRSPLVRAADRTIVLDDAVKTIESTPTDPAAQLRLAYSYIQALDTYQSAVREGELGNLGALGTRLQQWMVQLNKVANEGAFLPKEVALNIAKDAKQLVQTITQGATRKQREFASRARVSGIGEMWEEFVAGLGPAKTASAPATSGPKIGERRKFPNGVIGEWDGQGWRPVQP